MATTSILSFIAGRRIGVEEDPVSNARAVQPQQPNLPTAGLPERDHWDRDTSTEAASCGRRTSRDPSGFAAVHDVVDGAAAAARRQQWASCTGAMVGPVDAGAAGL